jgi:hypothetical protein
LGTDLVIECYAKIQYMPPRIVFDASVGLPCALLELGSVNRVDGDRLGEATDIYTPIPLGRGTVEGCTEETPAGRGDTLVVVVVGRASGCRLGDVDRDDSEARFCLRGNAQLNIRLNHDCFIADCSSSLGVGMAMRVGGQTS